MRAKHGKAPQTRDAKFRSDADEVIVLEFAHSQPAAADRNRELERKHGTQALLIEKGFHLLAWSLGIFLYWLLFHESVHGIFLAIIEALGCHSCQ